MTESIDLEALLPQTADKNGRVRSFALICLGVVESLAGGAMTASEAIPVFFHADNCLFVRKQFKRKTADRIMSHGAQLPDLFEALPPEEAQREFQRELATMRSLCLELLERKPVAA